KTWALRSGTLDTRYCAASTGSISLPGGDPVDVSVSSGAQVQFSRQYAESYVWLRICAAASMLQEVVREPLSTAPAVSTALRHRRRLRPLARGRCQARSRPPPAYPSQVPRRGKRNTGACSQCSETRAERPGLPVPHRRLLFPG